MMFFCLQNLHIKSLLRDWLVVSIDKWISKRVLQENKVRQISWKTNISYLMIRTRM